MPVLNAFHPRDIIIGNEDTIEIVDTFLSLSLLLDNILSIVKEVSLHTIVICTILKY